MNLQLIERIVAVDEIILTFWDAERKTQELVSTSVDPGFALGTVLAVEVLPDGVWNCEVVSDPTKARERGFAPMPKASARRNLKTAKRLVPIKSSVASQETATGPFAAWV